MVAMRPDGRVPAMVGASMTTRAVRSRGAGAPPAGILFKLFVDLAALRAGHAQQHGCRRRVRIGSYEAEVRTPLSWRHAHAQCIASSIKTVAGQLSEAMGRKPVINAARDLAYRTLL